MLKRLVAICLLALLVGVNVGAQSANPVVIASHSILADVARIVAGDHLDVRTLIPAGSDPHHFIPTPSDLAAVAEADLVLINGIGYEETLLEAIENAGADVNIVVASACIDVRPAGSHEDEDDHAHEDEDDHANEGDDDHAHEDEDDHADEGDDDHAHEDEDDHADEGDDDHAHEDEDDHADEDDDEHAHEDEDDHADEDDDDHAHEDDDDHADEGEMSGCDAQDAEVSAMGIHVHGEFLGRAGEIECAAHDHDDEHEDEHGDEHEDEHGDEHDDHGEMHDDHGHEEGACDPHIWFDPHNVIRWALTIRDSFSEIDPDHASEYHERALAYAAKLVSLEADFIAPALENLPVEKRLLVTAHDALGYLAGTFNFQIVSTVIPGVSTVVEPSASDVAAVIDVIRERDVQAIFGESITSDKILQVIAAETGVEIAPLYTDSLSQADGPAATYLEYMRYNFTTIVEALSG